MMKVPIIIIVSLLCFTSCKKKTTCKASEHYGLLEELLSYNFQKGSIWKYQNVNSKQVGEMSIDTITESITITNEPGAGEPATSKYNNCNTVNDFEYRAVYFKHNLFGGNLKVLFYGLRTDMICMNPITNIDQLAIWALPSHSDDTLRPSYPYVTNSSLHPIKKVFKVAVHKPLIIQSISYPEVYEIYYYPDYSGFRKIWWAPNVGFVKLEAIDSTDKIETWELIESHPKL